MLIREYLTIETSSSFRQGNTGSDPTENQESKIIHFVNFSLARTRAMLQRNFRIRCMCQEKSVLGATYLTFTVRVF
jgi:hypothetical protein